jgi:uncharacterized membrane protein YccC
VTSGTRHDEPSGRDTARTASSSRGPDIAAPHWLAQLLKPRPAPIDWKRAARTAIAIPAPIAVGLAFGQLGLGMLVSIGALCGSVTSISGPYRDRARRVGLAVSAGAVGFFLGDLVGARGWWTAVLIVGVAALSAIFSAGGNNASLASLQLLVYTVLGTHEASVVGPWTAAIGFLVGAGWALLLAVAAWPVRATAPERALVAAVYTGIAEMLSASGTAAAAPARQRLTTALNSAYDALISARSRLQGRDKVYLELFTVLSETTPVVEAAVAMVNARHRPPQAVLASVVALGEAIAADEPPVELELPDTGSPSLLALVHGLNAVTEVLTGDRKPDRKRPRPVRRTPRERATEWFETVLAGPAAWLHALRLALCMTVAEVLVSVLPMQRSYWLFMTIAIVLKPDFGSVFGRALLRGGGTFVGALVGAAVLALAPNGWVLVLLVAGIGFLLPIAQVRNYGMFSTVLTPLVVVQLDLAQQGSWDLVLERLADTALGCAIVLVFGYLLWPGSRTPRIGGRVAEVIDAVADYAERALNADPRGRSTLRRRAYRQLSDLRIEFQRMLVEPSAAGRLAAAWYPAIVALERTTSSVTRFAVEIDEGEPPPPGDEVTELVAAIRDTAAAVRDQRTPADAPELASDRMAALAGDVNLVISGLRGPDLDARRPRLRLVRRLRPS